MCLYAPLTGPRGIQRGPKGAQKGVQKGSNPRSINCLGLVLVGKFGVSGQIPGLGVPKWVIFGVIFWGPFWSPNTLKSSIFGIKWIPVLGRGGPKRGPKRGHFQLKPSLDSWFEREIPDFRGLDQNLGSQDPGFEGV